MFSRHVFALDDGKLVLVGVCIHGGGNDCGTRGMVMH